MMNQLIRTTTKKYIKNISKQIANKPRYFASAEVGERPEPNVCDSLLQIGSRRIYSQEHDMYREMLRNFYDEKVVPFHEEWEDKGEVPRELWTDAGGNQRHSWSWSSRRWANLCHKSQCSESKSWQ